MEWIALYILCIQPIYSAVLGILGLSSASGQLQYFYIIGVALALLCAVRYCFSHPLRPAFFVTLLCLIALIAAVPLTAQKMGFMHPILRSMYLSFGSGTAAAVLMAALLSQKNSLRDFCRALPWFSVTLTVVTFIACFFADGQTSGGLVSTANGLNYQTITYYSAFAFGYNIFCATGGRHALCGSFWGRHYRFLYLFAVCNVFSVLFAGGRGGTVLLLLLAAYLLFAALRDGQIGARGVVGLLFCGAAVLFGISVLSRTGVVNTAGFERILAFFSNPEDVGRSELRELALEGWRQSPVFGHGVGSVFYFVDHYSHNCVTDWLCEIGVVGCTAVLLVLLYSLPKLHRLIRRDPDYRVLAVLLLCGFVHLLFSGYYLSELLPWFPVIYVLTASPGRIAERSAVPQSVSSSEVTAP